MTSDSNASEKQESKDRGSTISFTTLGSQFLAFIQCKRNQLLLLPQFHITDFSVHLKSVSSA